jgi:polysaccharide deacetylase family protein (PEP-CTERM system associated)
MREPAVLNALTIDLEDWAQAVLDPSLPVTTHVVGNVERLLAFLDRWRVKATFFALGRVCERFPQLLPTIDAAGHEIASHGYGHELLGHLTPDQFRIDVKRSIEIIKSQIGRPPLGFRAPAFSITARTRWAGPILAELGFRYSSSIFPIRKKRYGVPDAPRIPHHWPDCPLVEFPLTTLRVLGTNVPVCGGGYIRLFPAWVHAGAIRRLNATGHPAVVYLHPYEFAPDEIRDFKRSGITVSPRRHLMQSLWRSRVPPRLERLLERFQFARLRQLLDGYAGSVSPALNRSYPTETVSLPSAASSASYSPINVCEAGVVSKGP